MRPSAYMMNAAKKAKINVPVEIYPLFFAVGVAICSGTYFTYKKFRYDDTLRLSRNPATSAFDEEEAAKK